MHCAVAFLHFICFSAPRHPRVAEVLVKHDALICESVSLVRERDVYGLLDVFIPPFPPKAAYVPSINEKLPGNDKHHCCSPCEGEQ